MAWQEGKGTFCPKSRASWNLIFGLALSIGALILINTFPKDSNQVVDDVLAFTYGFIILVFIWEEVTKEMLLFKVETTGMLRMTYILLFLVTLEPYLFNLNTQHTETNIDELSSMLYAADLAGLMVILAFFARKIINGEGNQSPYVRHLYNWKSQQFIFTATVFVVSMAPVFWNYKIEGTRLRYVLWIIAPIVGIVWGMARRYREGRLEPEVEQLE